MPRLSLGLLVLALAARAAAEGVEDMELVLHLHHSLDMGATWEERGTLALHTSRAGATPSPLASSGSGSCSYCPLLNDSLTQPS